MGKELTALKEIKSTWNCMNPNSSLAKYSHFDIIETKLKDYEELEEKLGFDPTIFKQDFETLMKEHKALEIIKNKPQTLLLAKNCNNYDTYFKLAQDFTLIEYIYSPEEFGLLKEVLL